MFPRLAIHTGNTVIADNKHPRWKDTIVLQHNETTATILFHGAKMTKKAKARHPILSTFQSKCESEHWAPFQGDFLGNPIVDGQVPEAVAVNPVATIEVRETIDRQ